MLKSYKPNVLFITSNLVPPFSGDSILSLGVLYRLKFQADLTVFSFGNQTDWKNEPATKGILDYHLFERPNSLSNKLLRMIKYGNILQSYSFKYTHKILSLVKNKTFDYVIVDHLRSYSFLKSIDKALNNKTKIIYLAHNVEGINIQQKISQIDKKLKRLIFSYSSNKLITFEKELIEHADIVWTLTKQDYEVMLKLGYTIKKHLIIPAFFPWKRVKPENSLKRKTKNILFLGSMQWYPNVQGALHFIEKIFPLVLSHDNEYKLFIVGQKPDNKILEYQSKNIIVTGKVVSVDKYINNCDFLVIPNRAGSGIKIKVMEAILKGLPTIMYEENAQGYDLEALIPPFVVKTPEEFSNAILTINDNYNQKSFFVNNSMNAFKKYYDFDFQL